MAVSNPPMHQRPPPATTSNPAAAFLSERAKLEQERLERLKRTRPDIHRDTTAITVDSDSEDDIDEEERARSAKSTSTRNAPSTSAAARARPAPATGRQTQAAGSIFWEGELRQTANMHVDKHKDTRPVFRLSEIISPKEDIEFAIVSAFCWNFAWVYQMFDRKTPVIAVDHSPAGEASIKAILPNWIRTTPFLRGGFGCMHMKFMLLFYKTGRLRVVISTANVIEYDWRDIENTVWVQDVPKLPSPIVADPKKEDFASAMVRVLHGVNVAPALVNFLSNDHPDLPLQRIERLRTHWDWSKVKAALIPSIAGKHEGWPKVILSGHTSLMKALIDMGAKPPSGKELVLECQGSSLGTYSTQWLNEFYCSARGESAQTWLDVSKARRAKLPFPPIKILFPTARYVRESVLGEAGGGTMFCRRKQWEGKNFPRELFHQTKSKRGRVLMHSKMVLGTFRDKRGGLDRHARSSAQADSEDEDDAGGSGDTAEDKKLAGWVYVGSHNFTPSAWGTLSGSGFNPTLNITNYELGVLIPLHSQEEIDRVACWERPPQKYVSGRDEPWIQSESAAFVEEAG
ncbi:phospholipase D/nuclease [Polyporus arcularius HHB13444]|uniref:Phospholipase D/nuclease n=1 Tax=Polyporus arcularius HHB13444 TaxID=1314778 RepID=A0A5C3P513_9APHY|nr:phospholipase D/nuclease [Polyporus arcularius HHB13444]